MADKYSLYVWFSPTSVEELWAIARRVVAAVEKYDHAPQSEWTAPRAWRVMSDERSWSRPTLSEVRKAAQVDPSATFAYVWSYYGADLQWSLTGQTFKGSEGDAFSLNLNAYAGRDRMRTEAVVRDVVGALGKRGISLKVGETSVSSSDDGDTGTPQLLAPRRAPRGLLAALTDSIKKHVGSYVVGVLLLLTGGILAALGIKVN